MREVTFYSSEVPTDGLWIAHILLAAGYADTHKEAKQLVGQGLIKLNGKRIASDSCIHLSEVPILLESVGKESVQIRLIPE